jgi:hypothetical protein
LRKRRRLHHRQCVERLEPVFGQRIVVDEEVRAADEEGAGAGDVEVIERLDRVGLDAIDPDDAGEGAEGVAGLEFSGLGPAEVSTPEPVIDAAYDVLAVRRCLTRSPFMPCASHQSASFT